MDKLPGGQCTICNHPQRGEIDTALVAGMSYRAIARHPDPSVSGCMSPRGGRLSPPPATDRAVRTPGSSSAATGPACHACHLWRSV